MSSVAPRGRLEPAACEKLERPRLDDAAIGERLDVDAPGQRESVLSSALKGCVDVALQRDRGRQGS